MERTDEVLVRNMVKIMILYGIVIQIRYAIRYGAVVIGFIALTYLDIVNFLTLFAGIMGLKVSAYLQPLTHEIFQKFQKS